MNKTVEAFLWIVFIGALSLSMSGCAAARILFLPGPCHPDEMVDVEGGAVWSPNPCEVPRRP